MIRSPSCGAEVLPSAVQAAGTACTGCWDAVGRAKFLTWRERWCRRPESALESPRDTAGAALCPSPSGCLGFGMLCPWKHWLRSGTVTISKPRECAHPAGDPLYAPAWKAPWEYLKLLCQKMDFEEVLVIFSTDRKVALVFLPDLLGLARGVSLCHCCGTSVHPPGMESLESCLFLFLFWGLS